MGNCTAVIKKKSDRPFGRSVIAVLSMSSSYATGGDTVPISIFGIGKRLSALMISGGALTPTGHAVELIPGATEFAAPLIRVRDVAAGTEIANATNLSASSITVEAIASPYK